MQKTTAPYSTDHLYFLYDTGETIPLLAVMEKMLEESKDFRFIAVGSSVNSLTKDNFRNGEAALQEILKHRITFKDLEISKEKEIPATGWARTASLDKETLETIVQQVKAKCVHVGTASHVQVQIVKRYRKLDAKVFAYPDNLDYMTKSSTFEKVVKKVYTKANVVLYPSQYTANLLEEAAKEEDIRKGHDRTYSVVGKPTLDMWRSQIAFASRNKTNIFEKLGLTPLGGPVVAFMDGYDNAELNEVIYSTLMSPLFEKCAKTLRKHGYQVVIQPHPKLRPPIVKTPELLAISDFVIGYNSSTVYDSAIIGKKAIFMIPKLQEGKTFDHFSIRRNYTHAIYLAPRGVIESQQEHEDSLAEHLLAAGDQGLELKHYVPLKKTPKHLVSFLDNMKTLRTMDIYEAEAIPQDSIQAIMHVYKQVIGS